MRKILLIGPVLALLAACDRGPAATPEPVEDSQPSLAENKSARATAEAAREPETSAANQRADTINIKKLSGIWEVVGVAALDGNVSVFGKNDPLILKSRIDIGRGALSWTSLASDEFTADDKCREPVTVALPDGRSRKAMQDRLAAAATRLAQSPAASAVYRWSCIGGGDWGPEADGGSYFLLLANGQMVTSWYDNVALLFNRINGVAGE